MRVFIYAVYIVFCFFKIKCGQYFFYGMRFEYRKKTNNRNNKQFKTYDNENN